DNFTVLGPDRGPVVTGPGNQFHLVNTPVAVPIVASDPDGQPLTYSATGLPPGLSVNPTTGIISGTLTGATGGWNVVAIVSDGILASQKALNWVVGFTNNAPLVTAIADRSQPAGTPISLQVQ